MPIFNGTHRAPPPIRPGPRRWLTGLTMVALPLWGLPMASAWAVPPDDSDAAESAEPTDPPPANPPPANPPPANPPSADSAPGEASLGAAPRWETSDTVLGATVAAGGALVGTGTGMLVGALAGANSCDASDGDSMFCFGQALLGLLIGGVVVGYAGSVGGLWLYADEPGLDGRISGVLIGAAVGEVVGIGTALTLCQLDDDSGCLVGVALGLAIWGTGAALGYRFSLPDEQVAGAPLGGLFDYDPHAGLRVGTPSAGLMAPPPGRGEGFGLTLTLGAGRF